MIKCTPEQYTTYVGTVASKEASGTLRRPLVLPEPEYEKILEQAGSSPSSRNSATVEGAVALLYPPGTVTFRCEDGFFRCNNTLQCIEQSKNCNGFPDCDDGSDELECDDDVGRNYYDHYFRKRPAAINDQLPYTPCSWNDANNTCKCRGTDVLCEYKGLTALPSVLTSENVTLLDLTGNVFIELNMNVFQRFPKLSTLVLRHCSIERIEAVKLANSIDALHLDQNGLTTLPDNFFPPGTVLRILYLNNNRLRKLVPGMIPQLVTLQTLSLAKNQIEMIEVCALDLPSLEHLHFTEFHHCKAALHVRVCEPKGDGISSNRHLLDNPVLRASVWIMAAVGIVGNLLVLFGRYVVGSRSSQAHAEHSLYLRHLAASDLLMGVYLGIIATADIIFRGEYLTHDEEWRMSSICAFSGFLSTLSCQSSTLLLTLVTWDRLVSVTRPLYQRSSSKTRVILRLAVLWSVATAAAVAPLSATEYFGPHFYGSNGVCLSVHIHDPYAMGWEYSAGLFILVNTVSLLFIGISYLRMLQAIRVSRNETRNTLNCREKVVARRFAIIVATDCVCWMPVIVVKLVALAAFHIVCPAAHTVQLAHPWAISLQLGVE
uniref:G-protein coupled receptors family 1 profile domain-containing protein n=1 Tax=Anopheles epiroticus TaxID=199890 RepID=A0A182P9T3_9DIPT